MMQNTMKSPLMDNTDENVQESPDTSQTQEKNATKFSRSSSRSTTTSTQTTTTINYNLLNNNTPPLNCSPRSPFPHSVLNSTHINSAILCRICYNGEIKEPLLQPCDCSGTMGLVHKSCLEKWLSQCNKNQCEICNFNYDVNRQRRPFSAWIYRPITTKDTKNLLNDLLCFLILTPLAFLSIWYCIGFAFKFTESINRWESSGLVILTTFLVIIYFLWLSFSSRYHYKVFRNWQEKNQIVTLNLEKTKILLPSDMVTLKGGPKTPLRATNETTISADSMVDADKINIDLVENPNFDLVTSTGRKSIYRKQADSEYKVESCVIEV